MDSKSRAQKPESVLCREKYQGTLRHVSWGRVLFCAGGWCACTEAAHRKGFQPRACLDTRMLDTVYLIVVASVFFCAGGWCMCASKPRTENSLTDWMCQRFNMEQACHCLGALSDQLHCPPASLASGLLSRTLRFLLQLCTGVPLRVSDCVMLDCNSLSFSCGSTRRCAHKRTHACNHIFTSLVAGS